MTATATRRSDRLRALARDQLARDAWSRNQLLAYQQERLDALLVHAIDRSPYYREVLDPGAGFASLPTLSKATLMEQWDRIVCEPRLRLADVEAHAAGPRAAEPLHGEFQVFSTSGASGCASCSPTSSSARPSTSRRSAPKLPAGPSTSCRRSPRRR